MEIDKDYLRFKRWFREAERGFHCGQCSDEQIAHAAWCEGRKHPKAEQVPAQVYYVSNDHTNCACVVSRQVYSINTTTYCTVCGKPIVGNVQG
jgi:hypothetical protein